MKQKETYKEDVNDADARQLLVGASKHIRTAKINMEAGAERATIEAGKLADALQTGSNNEDKAMQRPTEKTLTMDRQTPMCESKKRKVGLPKRAVTEDGDAGRGEDKGAYRPRASKGKGVSAGNVFRTDGRMPQRSGTMAR